MGKNRSQQGWIGQWVGLRVRGNPNPSMDRSVGGKGQLDFDEGAIFDNMGHRIKSGLLTTDLCENRLMVADFSVGMISGEIL